MTVEHLSLTLGQLSEAPARLRRCWAPAAGELGDQAAGDRRRQQRFAAGHDVHGLDELGGLDVLEDEAAGTGAQTLVDVLVEVEGGQHQHAGRGVGIVAKDCPGGLQAVHLGHANVHEDDVRLLCGRNRNRLGAIRGLTDDLNLRVGT